MHSCFKKLQICGKTALVPFEISTSALCSFALYFIKDKKPQKINLKFNLYTHYAIPLPSIANIAGYFNFNDFKRILNFVYRKFTTQTNFVFCILCE